jgi:hypothetical protein
MFFVLQMLQINSGEEGKTKYTMKPPVVYREGTKKTIWVNFPEICKIMERSPEHVLAFLLAEVSFFFFFALLLLFSFVLHFSLFVFKLAWYNWIN